MNIRLVRLSEEYQEQLVEMMDEWCAAGEKIYARSRNSNRTITYESKKFPQEALEVIIQNKEKALPYLRKSIAKAIEDKDELEDILYNTYNGEIKFMLDNGLLDKMCLGKYDSCVDEMFTYRRGPAIFQNSRTLEVERKVGRNAPCPCGSGKSINFVA